MFECLLSDIFQCSINIPVWLLLYRNIELVFTEHYFSMFYKRYLSMFNKYCSFVIVI